MNIAALNVKIGADIADFNKGIDAVVSKFNKVKGQFSGLANVGQGLQSAGRDLTVGLTLPIVALGAASIKSFGDIQALKLGLEAVTGSSKEAGKQFQRLRQVAKLPGLGLSEAVKGSINLQTIGFSAEKAEKSLKVFGNAVATVGKGRAEFERAIYGLQQLSNTEFPLGEDLNILRDAIPQITPLLKEAFGTARTEELQKLGITSEQVVNTILDGLGKLPPVAGGINNAFENLGDTLKNSLGRIGEDLNRAFNVEGNINKLADFIERATDAFTNLSPAVKNTIYVVAGLAAAIGPVLVVVGTVLTAIPSMVAGFAVLKGALVAAGAAFAAISAPITLTVAAIVGAGILIYKNWDKIKQTFQETGFLDKAQGLFDAVMNRISALVKATTELGISLWEKFGDRIIAVTDFLSNRLNKSFGYAFDQLLNTIDLFTNLFNGNWKGVWNSALKIVLTFSNFVLDSIGSMVSGTLSLFAELARSLGGDGLANALDIASNWVSDFSESIQVKFKEINGSNVDVSGVNKSISESLEEANKTTDNKVNEINEKLNKIGQGVLGDVSNQLGVATQKSLAFGDSFKIVSEKLSILEGGISGLIEEGFKATSGFVQNLQAQIDSLLGKENITVKVNIEPVMGTSLSGFDAKGFELPTIKAEGLETLGQVGTALDAATQKSLAFGSSFDIVGEKTRILQGAITHLIDQGFKVGSAEIQALKTQLDAVPQSMEAMAQKAIDVGAIFKANLTNAVVGFAELLGSSFNSGENFFDGILKIVAEFVGGFGKMLIAAGIGAKAFKENLLENPVAAIVAGAALVAISSAIKGQLSKGPGGGGGSSYTPATSGGGSSFSAGYNPSINDKVNESRELHITGKLTAEGSDLVYVFNQAQRKEGRIGG